MVECSNSVPAYTHKNLSWFNMRSNWIIYDLNASTQSSVNPQRLERTSAMDEWPKEKQSTNFNYNIRVQVRAIVYILIIHRITMNYIDNYRHSISVDLSTYQTVLNLIAETHPPSALPTSKPWYWTCKAMTWRFNSSEWKALVVSRRVFVAKSCLDTAVLWRWWVLCTSKNNQWIWERHNAHWDKNLLRFGCEHRTQPKHHLFM